MTTEIFKKNRATPQEWQKTESKMQMLSGQNSGRLQDVQSWCKLQLYHNGKQKEKKKHKDRGEYT